MWLIVKATDGTEVDRDADWEKLYTFYREWLDAGFVLLLTEAEYRRGAHDQR